MAKSQEYALVIIARRIEPGCTAHAMRARVASFRGIFFRISTASSALRLLGASEEVMTFKKGLLGGFGDGFRGAREVAQQFVRVVRRRLPFRFDFLPDDGQHRLGVAVKQGSKPIGIAFFAVAGMSGGKGGFVGREA